MNGERLAAQADRDAYEERREPVEIEREIQAIRADLDGLLAELDRRRHEALDWRLQIRRHQRELLWIGAGVVGVTVIAITVRRRNRRNDFANARELLHALRVVAQNPQALTRAVEEQGSSPGWAAQTAKVASAALPTLARTLLRDDA